MKKISILYILSLLLVACSQDEIGPNAAHVAPLRITTDDFVTRVAVNGDKFEDGDLITLSIYNQNNNPYFGQNTSNWYFYNYNGKTWEANHWQTEPKLSEEKAIIYATYPSRDYDLKIGSFVNIEPSQDGSQQEYLYASSEGHNYENPTVNLQFRYALAMVTVNLLKGQMNAEDDIIVSSATLKNAENCTYIATSGIMNFPSGDIEKEEDKQSAITLNVDQTLSVTAPVTTTFLVIPTDTSDGVILSLLINGKERQVRIPATVWEKGKRYTYNVTVEGDMEKTLFIIEATITARDNTVMDPLNLNAEILSIGGTIGTPVDLGLSVKWADHNVGASSESEVGGQYMWGDPTGTATNGTYTIPSLTNISGTQYDIATKQWGGEWRLPTYDEINELIQNSTYQWTTRNGVEGGLFTSKKAGYTNKSIFMPKYYGGDQGGSVWTGTRVSSNTARALSYHKSSVNINNHMTIDNTYPQMLTVRPVCK